MSDFNKKVKEYFRLYEQKREISEQVRDINAEMKDLAEDIKSYMDNNSIPAIEFGSYNLKLNKRSRKQGISEKLVRTAFENEDECTQILNKLENYRETKTSTSLTVRNKV
jgi:regulator of replication initiation timing